MKHQMKFLEWLFYIIKSWRHLWTVTRRSYLDVFKLTIRGLDGDVRRRRIDLDAVVAEVNRGRRRLLVACVHVQFRHFGGDRFQHLQNEEG